MAMAMLLLLLFLSFSSVLCETLSSSSSSSVLRMPTDKNSDPCPGNSAALSCPVRCFRPDPVCGADGVTYWCGCADAACNGARVAKIGFCEVGNGGEGLLSGQTLLLVHIVWLFVLGFSLVFGFF